MPAPPSHAARPMENNLNIYGPAFKTKRTNGFAPKAPLGRDKSVTRSYMKKWIRSANSTIPSTAANDSCQPASNNCVGLISKRIIAANDKVLTELECRRKKIDAQNTQHIIAALKVGARGGTTR